MIASLLASQARFHPHRTAVVDGDRRVTFDQLATRAARLANALRGLGCETGDRVAVLAANSCEVVEWFFACAAGGFVGLAVNTRLGIDAVVEMLADADPRAVLVSAGDSALADELRAKGFQPAIEVGFGPDHGRVLDYESVLATAPGDVHPLVLPPTAPFLLTATSGTTGRVKMTVHSHLGVYVGIQAMQAAGRLTPSSRVLTSLPMFFATATGGYWVSLFTGGELHLLPGFDAERFVDEIGKRGITHSIVGPSPLYQVMDGGFDLEPLRRMEFLGAGGAPFDDGRYRDLQEVVGGRLFKMYSMSELTVSTVLRPEDVWDGAAFNGRVDSVGRPQPGVAVRVLDALGHDVPTDGTTMGEVVFEAPGIATRYWMSSADSNDTFVDGTVRSGDLATLDADGFIRIVDRKKDLIVSGGINIAPLEVERALAQHPGVRSVAVIGVPHPRWGEAIHAVVVAADGVDLDADDILSWGAQRLAPVKKPRSVEFVDALPMNATGKVLRRVLRDRHVERANPDRSGA